MYLLMYYSNYVTIYTFTYMYIYINTNWSHLETFTSKIIVICTFHTLIPRAKKILTFPSFDKFTHWAFIWVFIDRVGGGGFAYTCIWNYDHIYICIYIICMYICIYLSIYLCIYIYIRIHINIYMHVYIHIRICINTYINKDMYSHINTYISTYNRPSLPSSTMFLESLISVY
jgi:hypothetical protein